MRKKTSRNRLAQRLEALQDATIELMASKQPGDVLNMVVNKAVDLLVCDAASLYLAHSNGTHLMFEIAVNRSAEFNFQRTLVPVTSRGLAAFVFRSGKPMRLRDAYKIPISAPYMFDNSFDVRIGYRTRSVIMQPLTSTKGEHLGVLQLINKKRRGADKWPSQDPKKIAIQPYFSKDDEKLLASFAAIASAAIEYAMLYRNIESVFEGFVTASIQAIESRDLATRGHSERVAILTLDHAQKVSTGRDRDVKSIVFTPTQLNELRYAALMHDFGKIGVREDILQKEEKLSPVQKMRIRSRLDDFKHAAEIRIFKQFLMTLEREQRAPTELERVRMEKYCRQLSENFEDYWRLILELNNPSVVPTELTKKLEQVSQIRCEGCDGQVHALVEPEDQFSLSIRRGSLTADERREIESHVTHTFHFLQRIPWTRELSSIPDIAYTHHEFLDGSGYPRGLKSEAIKPQTRIMTICDIFDALVANDRPYKPALNFERAFDILTSMAKEGKLDSALLRVFIEGRVYDNPAFKQLIQVKRSA